MSIAGKHIKSDSQKDLKHKQTEKKLRKKGDWVLTIEGRAQAARPVDYTFKKLTELSPLEVESARLNRLGILKKGPNIRLLSRGLWLNHNKLTTLKNLHELVNSTMEFPNLLGFLDLSGNELTEIHSDLFNFPNITVLYLHGNKLDNLKDIYALRKLTKLKHLTIYANPLCARTELGNIRQMIAAYLPKLGKLDHNPFTRLEREAPIAANALKILREFTGMPEDWLFKKFPKPALSPKIEKDCNTNIKNNSNKDNAFEEDLNQFKQEKEAKK